MSHIVDEFLQSLIPDRQESLDAAIEIILVCRGYIERHYKDAVFGSYQKTLLEVIDEFLNDQNQST